MGNYNKILHLFCHSHLNNHKSFGQILDSEPQNTSFKPTKEKTVEDRKKKKMWGGGEALQEGLSKL